MRNRLFLPSLVVFILMAAPLVVLACGGLFAAEPIDQTAERMIFAVNGDGTITAVVGIGYEGDPADFSWILPVPSVPSEVGVAETNDLDLLQSLTTRRFNPPPDYCVGLAINQGYGGGGGITVGAVGPYEYVIIDNDNPDELITWLQDNGYAIPDAAVPVIEDYVAKGMKFLAMKLAPGEGVEDIQPVRVTFVSDTPMIPIRLAAAASVEKLPLHVWIFGETQYVPENYAAVDVDFSELRGRVGHFSGGDTFFYGGVNYQEAVDGLQAEYDGKMFVTEFAMPTSVLGAARIADSALLTELIERFPYVTRLYGQLAPDQMTLDPLFVPAPDAQDMPQQIDLAGVVDPLEFFGCTTRFVQNTDIEALLPEHSHIRDIDESQYQSFEGDVRYPTGWTVQRLIDPNITYGKSPVYVIAPETVTWETFAAFVAGEPAPPMLVFRWTYGINYYPLYHTLVPDVNVLPDGLQVYTRPVLQVPFDFNAPAGLTFEILTTDADWQENSALYTAMVSYPATYQYYLSDTLRHTLFFGVLNTQRPELPNYGVIVAYPEGWGERIVEEGTPEVFSLYRDVAGGVVVSPFEVVLEPETAQAGEPVARLIPLAEFGFTRETRTYDAQALADAYGLAVETVAAGIRLPECSDWGVITNAIPFEHDGRRGFIRLDFSGSDRPYLVEASAASAQFDEYEDLLHAIADSVDNVPEYLCG